MIPATPPATRASFAQKCLLPSSPLLAAQLKPPPFSRLNPKFGSLNSRRPLSLRLAKAEGGPSPSVRSDEPVFVGQEDVPLEGVIQFEKPDSTSKLKKWAHVALLAGGDVLFLLLFAAIGRLGHGFPVFSVETLRTADPFIAGWFLSAYFLGGYGEDGRGMNGLTQGVIAAAKSWAVGIPLGVLIRSATSGHIPPLPFIVVSMGSTAVLLIGWRGLLCALLSKDESKKSDVYRRGNPFELFELLTSLVRRW
ncbi:hypothetical protein H6P81_020811 [Aristolochia fimbriata]|uniref:Uncharacterized protein n=1 Tax=Aristolochia fimbriata TaxID=158543 RepID=A0AAV7DWM4_ARIFI|nr:hypothetical protein H6P81_020811 [Aristolochia fimbriata]